MVDASTGIVHYVHNTLTHVYQLFIGGIDKSEVERCDTSMSVLRITNLKIWFQTKNGLVKAVNT